MCKNSSLVVFFLVGNMFGYYYVGNVEQLNPALDSERNPFALFVVRLKGALKIDRSNQIRTRTVLILDD